MRDKAQLLKSKNLGTVYNQMNNSHLKDIIIIVIIVQISS